MKRFTETAKWDDPWFRKLRPEIKLLWQWVLDRCDNAGVIDPDIDLASFQIGYQYPMDTLSEFGDRLVKLPCGKWFIPKFISYQYGQLSSECKAHKPIFNSLQKHFPKGYPKGINTLQEKEEEEEQETETGKDKENDLGLLLEIQESPPKDHLPKGWQKMSADERSRTRVNFNLPEFAPIGRLMGRRQGTLWTVAEAVSFKSVNPQPDEIELMERYYLADIPKDADYRRRDLITLLNHWNGELDRARIFKSSNQ